MANSPDSPLQQTAAMADGRAIPLIGLGTWDLRDDAAVEAVSYAIAQGYRHVDTATGYNNQRGVGAGVRESGVARDEVFVTTKFPAENVGRERETLEESLDELDTEYVDLWLIHWPPDGTAGVESWRELIRAHEDGLASSIGVSNYSFDQIDELTAATGVTPAVNQVPYGPKQHDVALLDGHRERSVVLEGYSPLKGGTLENPAVVEVARDHDVSAAQVILRWHLQHGVVAIPKSSRRERITGNVDIGGFSLSDQQMSAIDAIGR